MTEVNKIIDIYAVMLIPKNQKNKYIKSDYAML